MPDSLTELEKQLRVGRGKSNTPTAPVRAGFNSSRVATYNRVVERHDSAYGYYWRSYDFKPTNERGDVIRLPLGPYQVGNPPAFAFQHDGGEIIFSLPNGLQAYMLADGNDRRINVAPADLVFDKHQVVGYPAIVNGVSCINCHKDGMLAGFRDEVRDSGTLSGTLLEHVRKLYLPVSEMDKLIDQDRRHFTSALQRTFGNLVQSAGQLDIEQVGFVSRRYLEDLNVEKAAAELSVSDNEEFVSRVKGNADLRGLGLGFGHKLFPASSSERNGTRRMELHFSKTCYSSSTSAIRYDSSPHKAERQGRSKTRLFEVSPQSC